MNKNIPLKEIVTHKTNNSEMNNEQLIIALKKIVKPYIQDEAAFHDLSEDTDFVNDLKINSANLVDVILDVEDELDIDIDNDSMEQMLSVKAAIKVITTKLNQK